jgi:hypothetical protein
MTGAPPEELTEDFTLAMHAARLTDEEYLRDSKIPVKQGASQADLLAINDEIEKRLIDRVRLARGLPPRQKKDHFSLIQHALNNGVNPNYELPFENGPAPSNVRSRKYIQTLLLPSDMDRKLKALMSKCRLAEEETGINALKAAFGFLEWSEDREKILSPLILASVRLSKKDGRSGAEFILESDEGEGEGNFVLAEKMRLQFGLEFPTLRLDKNGLPLLENYFKEVSQAVAQHNNWRVSRQAILGLFPSARMSMYMDLADGVHDYENLPLIRDFVLGGDGQAGSYALDYEVERPEFEAKIPGFVLDADSSQASILIDLKDDRNLAIEGPPGSGKSQTIVNAIAAALADGKTVLFVAEKQAALEAVKSRLEAVGLGEYLMPLQAQRSTWPQAMASIRARCEMREPQKSSDHQIKRDRYKKVRGRLSEYVNVVSAVYGRTGLTVYDIIGRNVQQAPISANALRISKAHEKDLANFKNLRVDERNDALKAASELEEAIGEAKAKPAWRGVNLTYADPLKIEAYLEEAKNVAEGFEKALEVHDGLDPDLKGLTAEEIFKVRELLAAAEKKVGPVIDQAKKAAVYMAEASGGLQNIGSAFQSLSLADLSLARERVVEANKRASVVLTPAIKA